jgi:hypothetical protein
MKMGVRSLRVGGLRTRNAASSLAVVIKRNLTQNWALLNGCMNLDVETQNFASLQGL